MNCGIFDVARFFVLDFVDACSLAVRKDALLASSFRFECQTASDAAAFPDAMNGFGRRPLPAAISSRVRPEATEWSSSVTASPFSRAYASRCLMRSQLFRLLRLRSRF